jgi:acetyltransferase
MWQYSYNLRGLYETPSLPEDTAECTPDRARAVEIIRKARDAGRTILTEAESKDLLAAYCIPAAQTVVASSEEEAVALAEKIGYPAVLKLYSETITHKTEVGGVQLNLRDAVAVRDAWRKIRFSVAEKKGVEHFQGVTVQPMISSEGYEIIIGSSLDAQFGPVLLFGAGGQLVEVFKDRALALPPLNTTLARRLMEQTRIFKALQGVRGRKPVDIAELENLLVRFSRLVVEQRWIAEIDINPLLASPHRMIALDARVVLHGPEVATDQLPKPAIRPYPTRYVSGWTMKNGTPVTIRPIRPEDEPKMVRFHETLSERSVYLRYFHLMNLSQRTAHERLTRICFIDYDREMALVAERDHEVLAVGRLTKVHGANDGEVAVLVSDNHHGLGLGKELLARLLIVGADEKLDRLVADILPDNRDVMRILDKLGFSLKHSLEDEVVKAEFVLNR